MLINNSHTQPLTKYVLSGVFGTALIAFAISLTISCDKMFDVLPPEVQITEPTKGANIKVGKTTIIKVEASDNSEISEVEILVDNTSLGSLKNSPYIIEWTPNKPGEYAIVAKAYDEGGNWDEDEISITVVANLLPEIISFTANPTSGKAPLAVNFTCIASDLDGEIVSYSWDFGDGETVTNTSRTTSHTYENSGDFEAKVSVIDDNGEENSSQIDIVAWIIGMKKWEFDTGDDINSSPAIASDGTIYVGSDDNRLYAINIDGTKKWEFASPTGGDFTSSPAIGSDGTIYVGCDDYRLYAINPDGTKQWEFVTGAEVNSSPAIGDDGTIYVGSYDQKLYAISTSGTKKWEFLTEDRILASPVLADDGTIYVGSYNGKLYAVNASGTEKWVYDFGYYPVKSPSIASDGTIYAGEFRFFAINPDGSEKWMFAGFTWTGSSSVIGNDGTIYVASSNTLYAITPSGTQKWQFSAGDAVRSTPAIGVDGTIYVGSDDGKLYAINTDGTEKWKFEIGNPVWSSPAIGNDGTIFVGSTGFYEGKLFAIYGESGGLANSSWPNLRHDSRNTGNVNQ